MFGLPLVSAAEVSTGLTKGLGEPKPSAQEPLGESENLNNKSAQKAMCWGKLWGPHEQKWRHTVFQAGTKALSGVISKFPWKVGDSFIPLETEWLPLLPIRPLFEIRWPHWEACEDQVPNKENLLKSSSSLQRSQGIGQCSSLPTGSCTSNPTEVGWHLDKILHMVHNCSL
jgi:hypothetical protein